MKAFFWVLGICIATFLVIYLNKDNIRRAFFSNHILLNARGEANPALVRIDWTSETGGDTVTVFDQGHETEALYEARGPNQFMVYYNGERIGNLEHFKSNAYNPHTYIFELLLKQD
ncbi:hypothetical protein LVD17_20865 [Fulvivirga ulvae]|uniref:hypothetical protein n=1 Tax=Fulvivirga ulvae TaxID=2904245 RepID=UPI001F1987E4|nr:hypothetical protein [Fulvivirga ulvae]UII30749.1 hypothetical protein LVD17_20865 [Fulvivirga ulvae]